MCVLVYINAPFPATLPKPELSIHVEKGRLEKLGQICKASALRGQFLNLKIRQHDRLHSRPYTSRTSVKECDFGYMLINNKDMTVDISSNFQIFTLQKHGLKGFYGCWVGLVVLNCGVS